MSPTDLTDESMRYAGSAIGQALAALRDGLSYRDRYPHLDRAELFGYLIGCTQFALSRLERVDTDDVNKWLDEEHCSTCGQPNVAVEDDHGAPYCARCWPREVARQQQLDDDVVQYRSAQFTETDREGGA